jgi:hypothetical protein
MSNLERRRLPFFPPITGNHGCYRIWHSHFIPELLAWAGAQENPFDVHSGIHTEVTRIWECLYPSVRLSDDLNTILTIMVKWSPKHSHEDSDDDPLVEKCHR